MSAHGLATQTATELRAAFDAAFAAAAVPPERDFEALLTLQLGGEAHALRLAEIAGLYVDRKLVALPSPVKELLGIASLRGTMLPVYDLGALLGYAPLETPRWLVLARAERPVGLACGAPEALLRVPRSTFVGAPARAQNATGQPAHLAGVVRIAGTLRPLLDVKSVLLSIERASALHTRSRQ